MEKKKKGTAEIVVTVTELSLNCVNTHPATGKTHLICECCVFSTELGGEVLLSWEAAKGDADVSFFCLFILDTQQPFVTS